MSIFDIVLVVLLGWGAIKGFQHGLIMEVFSFLAFFIGLFLTLELTVPVSKWLFGSSRFFHLFAVIVFVLLFVALNMGIKALARMIKSVVNRTFLGALDTFLGAWVGALKWAFILSVFFWVFESVGFDLVERHADHTIIFPYIVGIGPVIFEWMSLFIPFVKDLVEEMKALRSEKDTVVAFCRHGKAFCMSWLCHGR